MIITDPQRGTSIAEIADGLFRVSTPVPPELIPGGLTFNQFLLVDEEPLLFHTGPRRLFSLTRDAVRHVLPPERLRWIAFSHVEADECGALNEWLAVAPKAQPLCSRLAALVSVADLADRPPRGLADGEPVPLGRRTVRWVDAPHLPHAMECGYLYDETDSTLLCGDLFSQLGSEVPPLTSAAALWEASEVMRRAFPYAPLRDASGIVDRLARLEPRLLACMHGASYQGDGGALLRRLSDALAG
jgi:glyoxylase-like metal-dependent hydrolase (beta-lactamase superfamily II)